MSANRLTPEMDLATRAFFKIVVRDESMSSSTKKSLIATLLGMLNYIWLLNGAFVASDTTIKMEFGTRDYSAYPDEWEADEERANAAIHSQAKDEASSSSESEDTEVREAVLPEDV